jgi:hypothetical protein
VGGGVPHAPCSAAVPVPAELSLHAGQAPGVAEINGVTEGLRNENKYKLKDCGGTEFDACWTSVFEMMEVY